MPFSTECFLEVHKNMEEVLLALNVPLTQYSPVENLIHIHTMKNTLVKSVTHHTTYSDSIGDQESLTCSRTYDKPH